MLKVEEAGAWLRGTARMVQLMSSSSVELHTGRNREGGRRHGSYSGAISVTGEVKCTIDACTCTDECLR